jgi:hypothetical protein
MKPLITLAAAVLLLSSPALLGIAWGQNAKMQVTKAAWQGYQQYLGSATDQRHTFFALSKDGQNWGQSGCPKGSCPPDDQVKASAMKRCEQFAAGVPCLIFAEDRNILVPYEVKEYTMYGQ